MQTWIGAIAIACPGVLQAQNNWVDAGMPQLQVPTNWIFSLPDDTGTGSLYVCGYLQLALGQPTLLRYSAGQWDTLGIFDQVVKTAVLWRDTLIVGGVFTSVDGVAVQRAACYANGQWSPYGSFSNGTINKLKVIGNELYAVGAFDEVDAHTCNGVAKRSEGQWVELSVVPGLNSNTQIMDIILFDNEPVACGTLNLSDGTRAIMRYTGTEWIGLGPGVLGGFSGLKALAVYNGELYAAGSVRLSDGNAGHGIMRWDGDQWHAVGGHLQDVYCGYSFSAPVYDMVVHEDKLFVAGGIGCAGEVPAERIAIWNGAQWCGLGTSFPLSATATSLAFLQDTLYVAVAPGHIVDGIPVNGVAKWIGGAFADTCSTPLGVHEQDTPAFFASLRVQDHSDGIFSVSGWGEACRTLTVHDATGRCVMRHAVGTDQLSVIIDFTHTAKGLYILRSDGLGQRMAKVLR